MRIAPLVIALIGTPALAEHAPPNWVAPPTMQRVAPAFAHDTDSVPFGEVGRRPQLAPRDRSVVTVPIATDKTAQRKGHFERALDNGVTPLELSGPVTHVAFYSGWPSAVSSLDVIDSIFKQRGIDIPALRVPDAKIPAPASDPERAHTVDAVVPLS